MSIYLHDIAYLTALVERAPSNYGRRKELLDELQRIYIDTVKSPRGLGRRFPILEVTNYLDMGHLEPVVEEKRRGSG